MVSWWVTCALISWPLAIIWPERRELANHMQRVEGTLGHTVFHRARVRRKKMIVGLQIALLCELKCHFESMELFPTISKNCLSSRVNKTLKWSSQVRSIRWLQWRTLTAWPDECWLIGRKVGHLSKYIWLLIMSRWILSGVGVWHHKSKYNKQEDF